MATRTNSISYSDLRMSRRTFIKLTALGTAAALSGINNVSAYPETVKLIELASELASAAPEPEVKLVKSVCSHCAIGCGFLGRVEDGVFTSMEPWETHPINAGGMHQPQNLILRTLHAQLFKKRGNVSYISP